MYSHYNTTVIPGQSEDVYKIIGPFAMSWETLREFDRYPIVTDSKTIWFVAYEKDHLAGFAALKNIGETVVFAYAYTLPEYRKKGIYKLLFQDRLKWCNRNKIKIIKADCNANSLPLFLKNKFVMVKKFSNWTKVEKQL